MPGPTGRDVALVPICSILLEHLAPFHARDWPLFLPGPVFPRIYIKSLVSVTRVDDLRSTSAQSRRTPSGYSAKQRKAAPSKRGSPTRAVRRFSRAPRIAFSGR